MHDFDALEGREFLRAVREDPEGFQAWSQANWDRYAAERWAQAERKMKAARLKAKMLERRRIERGGSPDTEDYW
jgi:hypothetical protein